MSLNAERSEKSARAGEVHASDRCSSLTEEIERGLVLGVPPLGEEVGYHASRLWVAGFRLVRARFLVPKRGRSRLLGR